MDDSSHKKWLDLAKQDLVWTKANIDQKIWYGACFTAQQAGEKALKAYLINKGQKLPRIHDLGALLEGCAKFDGSFEALRNECATLAGYYAPTRYPDVAEYIDFTESRANEALVFAQKIVDFVQDRLK